MARTLKELEAVVSREDLPRLRGANGQWRLRAGKSPVRCKAPSAMIFANVCSDCLEQSSDGECESRQQVNCALDAYLLPIINAIEESTGKSFDRTQVVTSPNLDPQSG